MVKTGSGFNRVRDRLHNPKVKELTVGIRPYSSPGYTHALLLGLVDMSQVDPGESGTPIYVEFPTVKDAQFFRDLCIEAGWRLVD